MKIADNEIPYLYLRALIDRNYGAIFNDLSKMEFMSNSISNSIKNNDELENALEKAFENKLFSSNSLKRRNEFANLKNYCVSLWKCVSKSIPFSLSEEML